MHPYWPKVLLPTQMWTSHTQKGNNNTSNTLFYRCHAISTSNKQKSRTSVILYLLSIKRKYLILVRRQKPTTKSVYVYVTSSFYLERRIKRMKRQTKLDDLNLFTFCSCSPQTMRIFGWTKRRIGKQYFYFKSFTLSAWKVLVVTLVEWAATNVRT